MKQLRHESPLLFSGPRRIERTKYLVFCYLRSACTRCSATQLKRRAIRSSRNVVSVVIAIKVCLPLSLNEKSFLVPVNLLSFSSSVGLPRRFQSRRGPQKACCCKPCSSTFLQLLLVSVLRLSVRLPRSAALSEIPRS